MSVRISNTPWQATRKTEGARKATQAVDPKALSDRLTLLTTKISTITRPPQQPCSPEVAREYVSLLEKWQPALDPNHSRTLSYASIVFDFVVRNYQQAFGDDEATHALDVARQVAAKVANTKGMPTMPVRFEALLRVFGSDD